MRWGVVMKYTPKNLDIAAFEAGLEMLRDIERANLETEKVKAQAYYDGFAACVFQVKSMLHCSNYEKKGGDEK